MFLLKTSIFTIIVSMMMTSFTIASAPFKLGKKKNPHIVIPFQLIKKLIVVKAFVNGKEGNFILDTGSEFLVINSKYFSEQKGENIGGHGVGGSRINLKESITHFSWQGKEANPAYTLGTSLEKAEQILGIPIMGYLGYDILKEYEIVLDYRKKEITLFALDQRGRRKSITHDHLNPTTVIPLKQNGYMPYLVVEMGEKKLRFGIDSGASLSLIRSGVIKLIAPYYQEKTSRYTAGFNGEQFLSESGVLKNFKVSNLSWPSMNCVSTDMKHLNLRLQTRLDGLLGYEFLRRYKISINYRKNMIGIWREGN